MKTTISWFIFFGFFFGIFSTSEASSERGIRVKLRASERLDAPVAEEVNLYTSSHALVIGIDKYAQGWPRLSSAVHDAKLVAEELRNKGFSVTLKTNLSSSELKQVFEEFFVLKGENPQARLFVWFAGHGHTLNGEGFLVPADAPRPDKGAQFRLKALPMRRFGEYVRLAQSKHVFAVFDSCFSGTIFTTQRSLPPAAITRATALPVRQFLASGDSDQAVSDDGTFRKLFIRAIRDEERADANNDGYLTASELGMFLSDRVTNLTRSTQTPRYGKLRDPDYDRGDFVFLLPQTGKTKHTGQSEKEISTDIMEQRKRLERERQQVELLKMEVEKKKLEAEHKRLAAEKKKLEMAKLLPEPKYSPRTIDLGLVHYAQAPKTFFVDLPDNFSKVEIGVYGKGDDTPNSYGGWNAWLKVNGQMVWKFKRWNKKEGGVITDYTRGGKEVREVIGKDKYLNTTSFFRPGRNQITYYHYTGGPGINVKIRIYWPEMRMGPALDMGQGAKKADTHKIISFIQAKKIMPGHALTPPPFHLEIS